MQRMAYQEHAIAGSRRAAGRLCAFTLVEMLIVVVILGILATTVIPMFTEANEDAKLATMKSNLNVVRRALQCYRLEHDGLNPDILSNPQGVCWLVGLDTESDGKGPYLSAIPDNPFTGTNSIQTNKVQEDGTNATAWYFGPPPVGSNAMFHANDSVEHFQE